MQEVLDKGDVIIIGATNRSEDLVSFFFLRLFLLQFGDKHLFNISTNLFIF